MENELKEMAKNTVNKRKKIKIISAVAIPVISVALALLLVFFVILPQNRYNEALELREEGEYFEAVSVLRKDANKKKHFALMRDIIQTDLSNRISLLQGVNADFPVAVKPDGTLFCEKINSPVYGLADLVKVSGDVGLKKDGSLALDCYKEKSWYDCDLSDLNGNDFVDVTWSHLTFALKKDGTVAKGGYVQYLDKYDVSDWKHITAIYADMDYIIGLKKNGTVVVAGENKDFHHDFSKWRDIIAIANFTRCTVGLKEDGTVVCSLPKDEVDVSKFKNIVAVAAGGTLEGSFVAGLKADGTVIVEGEGVSSEKMKKRFDVSEWTDIVAIKAGGNELMGLKSDGSVVCCDPFNAKNTADWNIK